MRCVFHITTLKANYLKSDSGSNVKKAFSSLDAFNANYEDCDDDDDNDDDKESSEYTENTATWES